MNYTELLALSDKQQEQIAELERDRAEGEDKTNDIRVKLHEVTTLLNWTVSENQCIASKKKELEKELDVETNEIIKHRVEMQKAVENVSGCGDCVLIPMSIWESLTNVYYNHESVSLQAHNLEQRAKALNEYAYSGKPLTKRGLNIESIALSDQAKALKECK